MIIGIDASRAMKPKRTGTEWYNADIIKSLLKIDHKNTYRLYSSLPPAEDLRNLGQNVEWRIMPFPRGWTLLRLSWEMLTHAPDVLFIPAHTLPLYPGKKSVVMIHDIGYDHFPELYKWTDKVYHHFDIRFAKRFASHILTPSEFTRQDLHQRYAIPLEKITTIHHGFDSSVFHPPREQEKPPIDDPYFFFIGRLEYKKNINRMIQAFAAFKQETKLPHKFILAGRPAYGYEEIVQTVAKLGESKKDISFLNYVPQETYTHYLRHATGLFFATLFEGFGFPVLEAFASETPVITSKTSSLSEIAGESAILVDPENITEMKEALIDLATDQKLRGELVKKGQQQYKHFSWEKTAQETLQVLKRVGHA